MSVSKSCLRWYLGLTYKRNLCIRRPGYVLTCVCRHIVSCACNRSGPHAPNSKLKTRNWWTFRKSPSGESSCQLSKTVSLQIHNCMCESVSSRQGNNTNPRKNFVFCDVATCSPFKVNWLFGGTCRLHLQGRWIAQKKSTWSRSRNHY
jgi:hypothetical protein